VKTLKAGTYKFVVTDKASIHNFVLEGPGVSRAITSVPFTGTKTVTVKLRKGASTSTTASLTRAPCSAS
jgi:hypothetical protein